MTELIQKGAKVTATDDDGNTPLHLAARRGFPDVGKELIRWGADPHTTNKDVEVPLEISICQALSEMQSTSLAVDDIDDFNNFAVLMCQTMKPEK